MCARWPATWLSLFAAGKVTATSRLPNDMKWTFSEQSKMLLANDEK